MLKWILTNVGWQQAKQTTVSSAEQRILLGTSGASLTIWNQGQVGFRYRPGIIPITTQDDANSKQPWVNSCHRGRRARTVGRSHSQRLAPSDKNMQHASLQCGWTVLEKTIQGGDNYHQTWCEIMPFYQHLGFWENPIFKWYRLNMCLPLLQLCSFPWSEWHIQLLLPISRPYWGHALCGFKICTRHIPVLITNPISSQSTFWKGGNSTNNRSSLLWVFSTEFVLGPCSMPFYSWHKPKRIPRGQMTVGSCSALSIQIAGPVGGQSF